MKPCFTNMIGLGDLGLFGSITEQPTRDCIREDCTNQTTGWFCHEDYLLKEATYGIHDIETQNPGFVELGVRRVREYIDYMNGMHE